MQCSDRFVDKLGLWGGSRSRRVPRSNFPHETLLRIQNLLAVQKNAFGCQPASLLNDVKFDLRGTPTNNS